MIFASAKFVRVEPAVVSEDALGRAIVNIFTFPECLHERFLA